MSIYVKSAQFNTYFHQVIILSTFQLQNNHSEIEHVREKAFD